MEYGVVIQYTYKSGYRKASILTNSSTVDVPTRTLYEDITFSPSGSDIALVGQDKGKYCMANLVTTGDVDVITWLIQNKFLMVDISEVYIGDIWAGSGTVPALALVNSNENTESALYVFINGQVERYRFWVNTYIFDVIHQEFKNTTGYYKYMLWRSKYFEVQLTPIRIEMIKKALYFLPTRYISRLCCENDNLVIAEVSDSDYKSRLCEVYVVNLEEECCVGLSSYSSFCDKSLSMDTTSHDVYISFLRDYNFAYESCDDTTDIGYLNSGYYRVHQIGNTFLMVCDLHEVVSTYSLSEYNDLCNSGDFSEYAAISRQAIFNSPSEWKETNKDKLIGMYGYVQSLDEEDNNV